MYYLKRILVFVGALIVVLLIYGNGVLQPVRSSSQDNVRGSTKNQTKVSKTTNKALTPSYYAAQLEKTGIYLHPGSDHRKDNRETLDDAVRCKSIVYKTLSSLTQTHSKLLTDLTLFYSVDGRRGYGGNGSIILRCLNIADFELSQVLTHEIGHLVDSGLLIGTQDTEWSGFNDFDTPVPMNDPSTEFYRISWISESSMQPNSYEQDFVSLYAMTDPFEDFAETYAYFRWHGAEFRTIALTSSRVEKKYDFMKDFVFDGKEFGDKKTAPLIDAYARNYDVTVLPILASNQQ